MKTQKLQFALTRLYDSQKNQKVLIKANRKILI